MPPNLRRLFPYFAVLVGFSAVAWACTFKSLEPADFTFANGTEIQSVDPAKITGAPEGRIVNSIFEGLFRMMPDPEDASLLTPQPAIAEGYSLSEDRLTYTFPIREDVYWSKLGEDEDWSNARPITANDFVWSWRRFLHPETAAEYAYQLYYVKNAKKYNSGATALEIGDRVEIELRDRNNPEHHYPTGSMLSGILLETIPPKPTFDDAVDKEEKDNKIDEWLDEVVWVVDIKREAEGTILWDEPGDSQRFVNNDASDKEDVTLCHSILYHFSEIGLSAPDDNTLVVELSNPTHFFIDLCAFYPLYPVNQECIEMHGVPLWTKPENIVSSGPYLLESRHIRDRIRLVKNPRYWGAEEVEIETIDALAVESDTTMLNLYMNGQVDWITNAPSSVLPTLQADRDDIYVVPQLSVYFYRINTTKPPLNDARVRRALNMAINKQEICEYITRGGQIPARSLVPPGIPGYVLQEGNGYDPEGAKALLAEAIADGVEMDKIQILFNTSESHKSIAETIMQQWNENLDLDIETTPIEWNSYLNSVQQLDYEVARAGWIGDYPDANTFLDMFVTDGANNQTGWSNERYDTLIELAASEPDIQKRLEYFYEAEQILLEESPIMPIYYYVAINMVRGYVDGFNTNIQDMHPLHILRINEVEKNRIFHAEGLR